jgi:leucyl aminopeptidase
MNFTVSTGSLERQRTGCIVVGVYEGRKLSAAALELDTASGRAVSDVVDRGDLEGELGTALLLHNVPKLACERVLLVGLGSEDEFRETSYCTAVCAAVSTLRTTGAAEATICLNALPVNGRDAAWKIEQAVLAVMAGMYRFDRLKSKPPEAKRALEKVAFQLANGSEAPAGEAAIARAAAIAEGVTLAKDLGNMPANLCTPTYLADQARKLGKRHGWKVDILEREDIERLGMGWGASSRWRAGAANRRN